jgi:hypothetical protein
MSPARLFYDTLDYDCKLSVTLDAVFSANSIYLFKFLELKSF